MDGRKVPLERAACSQRPAARLDPDTSSCVKFLMPIIFIIAIFIYIIQQYSFRYASGRISLR